MATVKGKEASRKEASRKEASRKEGGRKEGGTVSEFAGFPADAIAFFDDLEEQNTREWFTANKARYQSSVRGPMEALLVAVQKEFGAAHIFRPNRDTRFAHDKSPYKTNIGAIAERDGAIFYVHLDGGGLMAASGYYQMATDQLQRFRAAVVDNKKGLELEKALAPALKLGLALHEPALQRVPTGFPKDHPRAEYLRRKSMTLSNSFGLPKWVSTPRALDEVVAVWRAAGPLNAWLGRNVGPSALPQRR